MIWPLVACSLSVKVGGDATDGRSEGRDSMDGSILMELVEVASLQQSGSAVDSDGSRVAILNGSEVVIASLPALVVEMTIALPAGVPMNVAVDGDVVAVVFQSLDDEEHGGALAFYDLLTGDEDWFTIENPHSVVAAGGGRFFVTDPFTNTVVAYTVDGALTDLAVTDGRVDEVAVTDGRIFVSADVGIASMSVDPDAAMSPLGWVDYPPSSLHSLTIAGDSLFTSDEAVGGFLSVWDVSDPANMAFVDSFSDTQHANIYRIAAVDDRLYGAWYEDGLRVWDISDPDIPVEIDGWGSCGCAASEPPRGVSAVWADEDHVVVIDSAQGVSVLMWQEVP